MSNAYLALVRSGFIGSLKRDVLLETDRDLQYVSAIRSSFADAGEAAQRDAVACAVRLITELVGKGLCSLGTWSRGSAAGLVIVEKSEGELATLVAESAQAEHCFEYFLVATDGGREWVRRYQDLVCEL